MRSLVYTGVCYVIEFKNIYIQFKILNMPTCQDNCNSLYVYFSNNLVITKFIDLVTNNNLRHAN